MEASKFRARGRVVSACFYFKGKRERVVSKNWFKKGQGRRSFSGTEKVKGRGRFKIGRLKGRENRFGNQAPLTFTSPAYALSLYGAPLRYKFMA